MVVSNGGMLIGGNLRKAGVNILQYYFIYEKSSWIESEVRRREASPEPPDENMQNLLVHSVLCLCGT
jgi:hypothetical protein